MNEDEENLEKNPDKTEDEAIDWETCIAAKEKELEIGPIDIENKTLQERLSYLLRQDRRQWSRSILSDEDFLRINRSFGCPLGIENHPEERVSGILAQLKWFDSLPMRKYRALRQLCWKFLATVEAMTDRSITNIESFCSTQESILYILNEIARIELKKLKTFEENVFFLEKKAVFDPDEIPF